MDVINNASVENGRRKSSIKIPLEILTSKKKIIESNLTTDVHNSNLKLDELDSENLERSLIIENSTIKDDSFFVSEYNKHKNDKFIRYLNESNKNNNFIDEDNYSKNSQNQENYLKPLKISLTDLPLDGFDRETDLTNNNDSNEVLINFDSNELNQGTIEEVVKHCFDELSKNRKLSPNRCIIINNNNNNNNNNKLALKILEPVSLTNPVNFFDTKCVNSERGRKKNKRVPDIRQFRSKSAEHKAIDKCSQFFKENSALIHDSSNNSNESSSSLFEKCIDFPNETANTILLRSTNDIEQLYSLKITFV